MNKPVTINGDLLEAKDDYIVHQCNCVTTRAHGLSQVISDMFPYANPYSVRRSVRVGVNMCIEEDRPKCGSIKIYGDGIKIHTRKVVSFFAQYAPGKPGRYYRDHHIADSAQNRVEYFKQCLDEFENLKPKSVGFPHMIGCGLAGGHWPTYETLINEFAVKNPNCSVTIYKL